jgi:hypothetical protein
MSRAALLVAVLLGLSHPAFAEDVPAVSCEGQNCMQGENRPLQECEGQDCAAPAPAQAPVECIGQDCAPIGDDTVPGAGDQLQPQ